jgi:predicted RNase H-like HicB family nuclease
MAATIKKQFTAAVWPEDDGWVAQCLEVDVASQGDTEADALSNLGEALSLHFEEPVAAVLPRTRTVEVDLRAAA